MLGSSLVVYFSGGSLAGLRAFLLSRLQVFGFAGSLVSGLAGLRAFFPVMMFLFPEKAVETASGRLLQVWKRGHCSYFTFRRLFGSTWSGGAEVG